MEIYIKNSKIPLPSWVRGLITQVRDEGVTAPASGTVLEHHPICAYMYWRVTKTSRQNWPGGSRWNLYCITPQEGYDVERIERRGRELAGDVVIGRRDGRDIGFRILRVVASPIPLPNGTTLPRVEEVVEELGFLAVPPSRSRGVEGSVEDAFDRLPFHQPGGPGSKLEAMPNGLGLYENELVSFYAHEHPELYRANTEFEAVLKAAKDEYEPKID